MIKKVSFDFDDCLGHRADIQEFCKELIQRDDVEVWIVTSRPEHPEQFFEDWDKLSEINKWSNDDDLFPLADELGIPRERIVFTWWKFKAEWFKQHGEDFIFHLDDNYKELRELHGISPDFVPICCVGSGNWDKKCLKALNNFDNKNK
jgi:hypothetical protein